MNKTKIEWTDFTANPIKYRDADGKSVWACVKASDGCKNCYAEALAKRYGRGGPFTVGQMAKVEPYLDEAELKALLSVKRLPAGSKVFIGDMTDIFGPWVPDGMLDRVFAVFALRPDVVFQLLTKRPERMREYVTATATPNRISAAYMRLQTGIRRGLGFTMNMATARIEYKWWPLPNVWLGTSVEDQQRAGERIPELLACPAAVRFISAEPLLGRVDLGYKLTGFKQGEQNGWGEEIRHSLPGLDWVIVGGESGPGARACDVGWIRSIVQQCEAAGVAVFVKQLGARPVRTHAISQADEPCPPEWLARWDRDKLPAQRAHLLRLANRKGGDMAEWPADLRVREFPLSDGRGSDGVLP